MPTTVGRWTSTTLAVLLLVPGGVAAQSVDPTVVTDAPAVARAAVAALVVLVFGTGFVTWRRQTVDDAITDIIDRPKVAVAYGVVAFAIVGFLALFANNILIQAGLFASPLSVLVVAIPVLGVSFVGGLGFAVVGTLLTGVTGPHRPRLGVLVGAILSALCWVAVPLLVSVVAWLLVAAFGVGGTTRTWVHSERTVASETEPGRP